MPSKTANLELTKSDHPGPRADSHGPAWPSELNDALDTLDSAVLPKGGTTGQVCMKKSGADFDADWETPSGGGGSVRLDQILDPTADKTFAMNGHVLTFADSTQTIRVNISGVGQGATLAIDSATDVGGGQQGSLDFTHGGTNYDWELSNNSDGLANYEFVIQELTNNTNKVFIKKGTTGDMYLNPFGGNVGIGVDPAGSPAAKLEVNGSMKIVGDIGFFNTSAAAQQTVTGSKGGNAALASLMTALVTYGFVADTTS